MQQNPPAQSAAEILRQRLQKRAAGGQGGAPMQQNQDNAQAAAERLKQRMQQRQGAGGTGAGGNAGGNAGAGTGGSVKDFMNDKNLDSRKALTILNTPNLTLTDQEADHLLKAADLYSLSLCDLASDYKSVPNFNKTAIKKFIEEKIRKAGGIKNLITSEEEGKSASRRLQSTALSYRNDFEILLFLNNNLDLKMISPQLASEIIKEYKNKDYSPIDPDYIQMLEKIAITDKNLASETLKNMNFYDIERMFRGSKYVEICNEKIKLQGGINNLTTYEINPLIGYNVTNKLTGDRAEFISPQDAKKILMRSDLKELSDSYKDYKQPARAREKFGGGIQWLQNRARE
jgi:hypothetical protein